MAAINPLHPISEHPCARFIRAAQQLRERIKRSTEDVRELRETIAALQAADQPDRAKIDLLEKVLTTVEQQIREEKAGLRDFELEISLNC
jgi:septal ring factor EnvC (AmiA/AmiB activator)